MAADKKLSSLFFFFLKIAVAAGIVWILFSRSHDAVLKCFRSFDYTYLLPAMLFYTAHVLFSAWRWQIMARVLDIRLGYWEAFSLTMQGNFFSLVIPGGAIGGDVIKMGVVSKRSPSGTKMEGAFTVLMDRIVGMISLFLLTLVLLIPSWELLLGVQIGSLPRDRNVNMLMLLGLILLCLAGLAASFVIFFHRIVEKIPGIAFLMQKAEKFSGGAVSRVTGAADCYAKKWKTLCYLTLLTTFLVHLMTTVPCCILLSGLGVEYSVLNVVTAVTVGNIAGLIPISPGGIGIRDLVTITILAAGGIAAGDAKTVQLMATGIMLFFNLCGGLFFILDTGRRHAEGIGNERA